MDFDGHESCFGHALPLALVSLSMFTSSASPSPRRLLSRSTQPSNPVRVKRQLAWLSLQGQLFTPIQRVLIVAVVASAATNSKKSRKIFELRRSVELRDQVFLSMQQKLDRLCKEIDYFKDQPEIVVSNDYSYPTPDDILVNTPTKEMNGDDVFKYRMPLLSEVGPEERRMSDLSDWAPSVTLSVDVQQITTLSITCEWNVKRRMSSSRNFLLFFTSLKLLAQREFQNWKLSSAGRI